MNSEKFDDSSKLVFFQIDIVISDLSCLIEDEECEVNTQEGEYLICLHLFVEF